MSEVQSITNNDKAALFDWMNEASENNLTAYINFQHLFYDFHITSVAELLLCYSQKNHPKAEMFTEICSRLKPIPLKKLHTLMKETQKRSDQATSISTAVTRPSSSMEQAVPLFVVDLTGARTVCADLMMETTHIIPTNERSEGATTIEQENHNPAAEEEEVVMVEEIVSAKSALNKPIAVDEDPMFLATEPMEEEKKEEEKQPPVTVQETLNPLFATPPSIIIPSSLPSISRTTSTKRKRESPTATSEVRRSTRRRENPPPNNPPPQRTIWKIFSIFSKQPV